jgi:alkylated DNA repair dioxygenase AlkB
MACIKLSATNGAESILYNTIYNEIANQNEKLADEMYVHFKGELFKNDFGDYIEDYRNSLISDRTDENGEPLLKYNETAKKYFYTNKNNEKVYFPLVDRGLRGIWNYDQINKIRSRLALNYFKRSGLDFNNIDFTSGEKLENLENFVTKEITEKIKSLENEGEYFAAITLSESLSHVSEIVENVENFFKELSLKIVEDQEGEDAIEAEEGKDPVFNTHSAERSTKESVSTNVKLRLSLLEDKDNLDTIWNEPTFMDMNKVYSSIQEVLTDEIALPGEDIFELHKSALNRLVLKKPFLKQLVDYVNSKNITDAQKSELSQAFNLIKNNHIVTQFTTNKDGTVSSKTLQISDTGSKTSSVKNQWDENFQSKFLSANNTISKEGLEKINKASALIAQHLKESESLLKEISNEPTNEEIQRFENISDNVVKFLKALGVETTENGFSSLLDNNGKDISIKAMLKNLQTLIEQSQYVVKGLKAKYENPSENYSSFTDLSQTFTKLAKQEASFLDEGSDATILSGGKQKWIYSYPSYLSSTIKQWKKNPKLLIDLYNSGNYQKGSFYMGVLSASHKQNGDKLEFDNESQQIEASRKLLEKLDVGIMNQMSSGSNYKTTTDLSYKDYLTDYINKVLRTDDFVRTTTQADKSTELQIKNGIKVASYNGVLKGNVQIKKQTKDIFFNYFASEVNRMIEANQEIEDAKISGDKLTPHYHYQYKKKDGSLNNNVYDRSGNAFQSQYFPELSESYENKNELEKKISFILYKDGKVNFEKLERGLDPILDELFDQYLTSKLNKSFARTLSYLQSNDILARDEKGNLVPVKISDDILNNEYKSTPLLQKAYAVTMDFLVNGLIQNIEYSKMFTGDVAFYKNMVDYKKRVPATYTDGLQLRLTEGNEYFKIATINSVMRRSPFYDKLVESLGVNEAKPYESINSADAQAWITPDRWKFLIQGLGKWTKVHDSVYKKMNSDTHEPYTIKELKVAAQPLKGVYFYRDATGKPVYLKYSQAVLAKSLIQESDLKKLFDKMKSGSIDEVITFDGVKVGPIEPTTIHDEEGNIVDNLELNPQLLYNRGWKLQQDLPTKTYKDIDVGSQIQKNIFAGLLHNQDLGNFVLDGVEVSGRFVKDEIVKTVTGLTNEGLKSIKREFGVDDNYKIGNISGFYNALIAELEKRGGSKNIINALKAETTIVGIPQSAGKIFNIFASVMNSRLVKIKTNGGAFIQMSNFGFNKTEATKKGVRWNPGALQTTHEPYIYLNPETLKETVRPGGVLVPASFIAKEIPNWQEYSNEELFISYNGGDPIISKKIQENIIGYRIPNQGLASNDALEIAGILPEGAGDTIVAYTGITTKTGSDFDVDKMYIMFPSFSKEEDRLSYNEYNEDNITKNGLQNRLIELYKSVLTHPDVYKQVMRPIDIDFIEKELKTLFTDKTDIFMNNFDPEVDVKLRYSFLGGKAGVGQEANAMVDISREGNLSLYDVKNILWGHTNELGELKLDEEYSKPLSEEELDYYVRSIVKGNASEKRIELLKNQLRSVKTGDSLTAILNAFVDIAKDNYISKGNWTMSTTNVGNLLLRGGAHPLYVINFLANPIIAKYVEFQKTREGLTDDDKGDLLEKLKEQIVIENLNKRKIEGSDYELGNIYKDYFSKLDLDIKKDNLKYRLDQKYISQEKYDTELLKVEKIFTDSFAKVKNILKVDEETLNNIVKDMKKQHNIAFNPKTLNIFDNKTNQYNEYLLDLKYFREQNTTNNPDINFQINLIDAFKELQDYSKNIRDNITVCKADTNGLGKDHNQLISMFNLRDNIVEKFENKEKGSIRGFETKFENTTLNAYWNSLTEVKNIVENNSLLFPTGKAEVQQIFNKISNDLYGTNTVDTDLMSDLSKHYNTYLMSQFFDLTFEESNDILKNLPKKLNDFKKENEGKYYLLDELSIKVPKNTKYNPSISLNNRSKSKSYQDIFTDSWRDLMIDNPGLAEDLIKYSFITSGFQMNSTQFFTYIPSEYFTQKDINKNIDRINNLDNSDFVDKFYLNNLTDKAYVKRITNKQVEPIAAGSKEGFVLKNQGKSRLYLELKVEKPENAPADFVPEPQYYKLIGQNELEQGIYKRVKPEFLKINDKSMFNYSDNVLKEFNPELNLTKNIVYKEDVEEEFELDSLDYGDETLTGKISNVGTSNEVYPGVEIVKNALSIEEQLELFNIIKDPLIQQAAKTNISAKANLMIGLGLRWDYKSNNPDKKSVNIPVTINNSTYQKNKYGYYDKSINNEDLFPINQRLKDLVSKATGIDASNYDGAIINLYDNKTFISAHNDVDESADAINYPVLVVNIGGNGNFSIEDGVVNSYTNKKYSNNVLNSGDAYIFGKNGINRNIFHRTTAGNIKGILPEIHIKNKNVDQIYPKGSYRVTITLRRVMPLNGLPSSPKTKQEVKPEVSEYSDEFFKQIDNNNIREQLLNPKNKFTLLSIEQSKNEDNKEIGSQITEENIEEALSNKDRILKDGLEDIIEPYYILEINDEIIEFDSSVKTLYEQDFLKEKDPQLKEEARLMLNKLGFDIKTQEEIKKSYVNPNQLSLFDSIQDEKGFNEVKDKWESSGRTKEEWDLMSPEEREHVIKNCL